MKLRCLNRLMGVDGIWTGSAHRFSTNNPRIYESMQGVAVQLMRLPKKERIRWWTRASSPSDLGYTFFVDIAMH